MTRFSENRISRFSLFTYRDTWTDAKPDLYAERKKYGQRRYPEDAEPERVAKEHYLNKQDRWLVKEFAKAIIGSGAYCSTEVR